MACTLATFPNGHLGLQRLHGYDAAKKVKGHKRQVAVDTSGLLGVVVHAANIQDADSAWNLLSGLGEV